MQGIISRAGPLAQSSLIGGGAQIIEGSGELPSVSGRNTCYRLNMTARIAVVVVALLATGAHAGDDPKPTSSVLVEYHFDDEDLATGPDTMLIIQRAKGTVRLSERYRYSGTRSVEVRSVAGDGNFPELQGYLANRKRGTLAFHFALLVANPTEKMNIAIAGPAHFNLSKHGLAVWLTTTHSGKLAQVTNRQTEELFDLRAFTW